MKKSLIIIAACLLGILANAQDNKPTKEETVKFIDRTLKKAIGEKAHIFLDLTITDYQFNLDKITIVTKQGTHRPESEIYENMDWAGFDEFYEPAASDNQNIEDVGLVFKSKVKTTFQGESKYNSNSVILSVRKENVESVKKAILHLVKLAKEEEGSNPFK